MRKGNLSHTQQPISSHRSLKKTSEYLCACPSASRTDFASAVSYSNPGHSENAKRRDQDRAPCYPANEEG